MLPEPFPKLSAHQQFMHMGIRLGISTKQTAQIAAKAVRMKSKDHRLEWLVTIDPRVIQRGEREAISDNLLKKLIDLPKGKILAVHGGMWDHLPEKTLRKKAPRTKVRRIESIRQRDWDNLWHVGTHINLAMQHKPRAWHIFTAGMNLKPRYGADKRQILLYDTIQAKQMLRAMLKAGMEMEYSPDYAEPWVDGIPSVSGNHTYKIAYGHLPIFEGELTEEICRDSFRITNDHGDCEKKRDAKNKIAEDSTERYHARRQGRIIHDKPEDTTDIMPFDQHALLGIAGLYMHIKKIEGLHMANILPQISDELEMVYKKAQQQVVFFGPDIKGSRNYGGFIAPYQIMVEDLLWRALAFRRH